jgi:hypothetical protein
MSSRRPRSNHTSSGRAPVTLATTPAAGAAAVVAHPHTKGAAGRQTLPRGPQSGNGSHAGHAGHGEHGAHETPHGPKHGAHGGHTPHAPRGPRTVGEYYMQQVPLPYYLPEDKARLDRHFNQNQSTYTFEGYQKNATRLVCYNSHKDGHDGLEKLTALVARKLKVHDDYKPSTELVENADPTKTIKTVKWALCQSSVVDPGGYPQNNLLLYMSTENESLVKKLLMEDVGEADAAREQIWGVEESTEQVGGVDTKVKSYGATPKSKPHLWVTRSFTGKRHGNVDDEVIGFISMLIPGTLQHIDQVNHPVTQQDKITGNVLQTFGLITPVLKHPEKTLDRENPNDWQKFLQKYGEHIYCTNINKDFTFHDPKALKIFDTYIHVIAKNKYAACWYDKTLESSDIQLCRKTVDDTLGTRVHPTHCHFLTVVNHHMIHREHKPLGIEMIQDMYTDICKKYNDTTWRNFEKKNENRASQDFLRDMHLHYLRILNMYAHTRQITHKREQELTHLLETSYVSFQNVGVLPSASQLKDAKRRDWISDNRDEFPEHQYFRHTPEEEEEDNLQPHGALPDEEKAALETHILDADTLRKWT